MKQLSKNEPDKINALLFNNQHFFQRMHSAA